MRAAVTAAWGYRWAALLSYWGMGVRRTRQPSYRLVVLPLASPQLVVCHLLQQVVMALLVLRQQEGQDALWLLPLLQLPPQPRHRAVVDEVLLLSPLLRHPLQQRHQQQQQQPIRQQRL